jgi:hypothetical protein
MNTHSSTSDDHQASDRRSGGISIRNRIAAGTVACIVLLSAAVMTSAPGSAAQRAKPKPTATATATPIAPAPTSWPTPTPSPTSSPTPTPTPPTCESKTTYGGVEYCVTTLKAIGSGKHAVGAAVAVRGTWVFEMIGSQEVTLGRNDCPADMFCGQTIATLTADFSNVQPAPMLDSFIDVYGNVTSDLSLLVAAYH